MSRRKNSPNRKNKKKARVIPEYEGKVLMSREGFAFVRVEGQEEDIFVKATKTRGALHGDLVRVAVTQERTAQAKRRSGEIIAILERTRKPFVGLLHIVGKQAWVLMSSKTMPYDIEVPVPEGGKRGSRHRGWLGARRSLPPRPCGGHPGHARRERDRDARHPGGVRPAVPL